MVNIVSLKMFFSFRSVITIFRTQYVYTIKTIVAIDPAA